MEQRALIGRDAECRHIDAALGGARAGVAAATVVVGDAGIGKSRMLAYAKEAAADFRILETRGVQADFQLAYSGLTDVLLPLVAGLDRLPLPQAAALRSVLALGPPGHGDRFAVAAGGLSLLAAASEDGPLLVVVDDAQWVDESSLEALSFAARRLRAERVLVLFAARAASAATDRLTALDALHLAGLAGTDAQALVRTSGGAALGAAATADLVARTGGNPLALIELAGTAVGEGGVHPVSVGPRLQQAFGERLDSLPARTRSALLVLACAGAADRVAARDALRADGMSAADLEEAEGAGLVTIGPGEISFAHPLVRSAVYQLAAPSDRRAAHRRLAAALVGRSDPSADERRCLHLAAAAEGVDDAVAAELEQVAEQSAGRGSYSAALQAFEQAAALTSDAATRSRRFLRAAALTSPAGRVERAAQLLDAAVADRPEAAIRVEAEHLRCRIEMWNGSPVSARNRLLHLAGDVEPSEPLAAAYMLAHAALASARLGEYRLADRASHRADQLASGFPSDFAMPVLLVRSIVLAIGGEVEAARVLLDRAEPWLEEWDPLSTEQLLLVGALGHVSIEATDHARRLFERADHAARQANALGLLPFQLTWRSVFEWRSGNWHTAYALAHESVALARETGWATELPHALAAVALIEAGMGRAEECRAHAAEGIELAIATGAVVVTLQAETALALLELGTQPRSAAQRLERVARFAADNGMGDPVLLPWAADLVEAHVRAGDPKRAIAALQRLNDEAERTGRPTERALAHRGAALVGTGEDAEALLVAALDWHAQGQNPFETARTRLALGEHLRRRKQKLEAQQHLHEALTVFEQLGAGPWVARARAELAAAGAPGESPGSVSLETLTPQEMQVALAASRGATNAEVAGQLFLSPKTVEYHLSRVYRKLGLRSRAQLSRAVFETSSRS